ncbi:sulfite exporter TauE/SafE family protein [Jiella avicenniae]|uniref:Probable membrane transporter protein n=1 Tax=Jiella avicenniae TaxID=2907202 RepID=A0A9X1TD88_9HYPH|nr:sulfite exporter TauE/SafE family protein [Jiella avicenniae]MCE7029833.1 sulfite exporter TauE/SafE family protein [Jiella avicenniae]
MTAALLPDGLSPAGATFLVVVSFFTSALTAAFALGGGVTLLAILSLFLPVQVLVPVHGVVQFASNFGRVLVQRRAVRWWVIGPFFVGAAIGAAIGARFVVALPEAVLDLTLGAFLLIVTFARLPKLAAIGPFGLALTGLATTFLSMFVGATGPINVAMFSKIFADRRSLVATLAAITAIQHALKVVAFFALGVALSRYAGLIGLLAASGFAGTLAGTHLLKRLDERIFRLVLTVILTVLAADLIRRGITGLW